MILNFLLLTKRVLDRAQSTLPLIVSHEHLSPEDKALFPILLMRKFPRMFRRPWRNQKFSLATQEEMKALEKNGTQVITNLPEGKKAMGCKWIFTIKYNLHVKINVMKQDSGKGPHSCVVLTVRRHLVLWPNSTLLRYFGCKP